VVDTDFGKVDGRIQTRLDELHRAAAAAEEGSP
jgi:flagellar assembly protein FliH